MRTALILLLISSICLGQSPASELDAAHADSARLAGEQAHNTRYLSIYSIPEAKRKEYVKLLNYWPNGISREPDFSKPRRVTETLFAIEMDRYGWDANVWEKLLDIPEPYWHVRVKVPPKVKSPKVYWRGGSGFNAGWYHQEAQTKEQIVNVPSPWVDPYKSEELSLRLNTAVPVVRADWFIFQSGDQQARKVGYYEWLGLKKVEDAQRLAGFNEKAAQERKREVAAIVAESGVGLNSRQIFRFGAIDGAWWETRDASKTVDGSNALRQLDKDFKFDAKEVFFSLPNNLFAFVLLNAKDELQATAPDTIASDTTTTNRNTAVRNGVSCIRCHKGLQPINDWGRKVFSAESEIGLGSPDRKVAQRLQQLYLGSLERNLKQDQQRYELALFEVCGLKPDQFQKLFSKSWADYESGPLLPADIAREIGWEEKSMVARLKWHLKVTGTTDTVVAATIAGLPLRREHFEEAIPLLMGILGNQK